MLSPVHLRLNTYLGHSMYAPIPVLMPIASLPLIPPPVMWWHPLLMLTTSLINAMHYSSIQSAADVDWWENMEDKGETQNLTIPNQ